MGPFCSRRGDVSVKTAELHMKPFAWTVPASARLCRTTLVQSTPLRRRRREKAFESRVCEAAFTQNNRRVGTLTGAMRARFGNWFLLHLTLRSSCCIWSLVSHCTLFLFWTSWCRNTIEASVCGGSGSRAETSWWDFYTHWQSIERQGNEIYKAFLTLMLSYSNLHKSYRHSQISHFAYNTVEVYEMSMVGCPGASQTIISRWVFILLCHQVQIQVKLLPFLAE